jgi:hypothetical protein
MRLLRSLEAAHYEQRMAQFTVLRKIVVVLMAKTSMWTSLLGDRIHLISYLAIYRILCLYHLHIHIIVEIGSLEH